MPLVHSDALHFAHPVKSYWEESADPLKIQTAALSKDIECDVAIIGGGFTGLTAAIELAQNGVDVCVLEAGHIGWGASGRNGGFVCIGSHKLPYTQMIRTYGLDDTRHYYRAMRASVDLVAENAEQHKIDIWKTGEGEISLAHLPNRMTEFRMEQSFMQKTFGESLVLLEKEELRQHGLYGPQFHGGLKGQQGFGVHPLNYVRGLARAAQNAGARLFSSTPVIRWEATDNLHRLYAEAGKITAKRVLVATNGYTPEHVSKFHAGRILPALSNIIVTRPLTEAERQAQGWTSTTMAYDSRNLLHYFRLLPNGRFLFGGRGGTDSTNAAAAGYQARLIATFQNLFPAWAHVEITHFWRGFVCLSRDRVPYVGPLDEQKTVWTSLAYHGNGVAMASWCGRGVARMMLGKSSARDMPAILTRRLAKFPLPMLRPLYLKGAYVWFGWQDSR